MHSAVWVQGGEAPAGLSADPGLGMDHPRAPLPLPAAGSVAAQGPGAARLGEVIKTEHPAERS